jgi:hypothetical protein
MIGAGARCSPRVDDQSGTIMTEQNRQEEMLAMDRVVTATQRVRVAFAGLQAQFPPQGSGRPTGMALQTFDAALQELEDAQAAFDTLLSDLLDGRR